MYQKNNSTPHVMQLDPRGQLAPPVKLERVPWEDTHPSLSWPWYPCQRWPSAQQPSGIAPSSAPAQLACARPLPARTLRSQHSVAGMRILLMTPSCSGTSEDAHRGRWAIHLRLPGEAGKHRPEGPAVPAGRLVCLVSCSRPGHRPPLPPRKPSGTGGAAPLLLPVLPCMRMAGCTTRCNTRSRCTSR